MPLFHASDLGFARIAAQLIYTNPFGAERIALERQALGEPATANEPAYWALVNRPGQSTRGIVQRITERTQEVATTARAALKAGQVSDDDELEVYDDLVLYLLFYRYYPTWHELHVGNEPQNLAVVWDRFDADFDYWLGMPGVQLPSVSEKAHVFAMLYQVYRAFYHIFDCIVGHSAPAAALRSQIWQSIFTHDLRRYRRSLYRRMREITTLVTGPSGSGKELVAQALGRSQYIPFSLKRRQFEAPSTTAYIPVNVSAFSVNLIESELFGYAKGAFTGAADSRAGWLETCGPYGTILLDEIGELEPSTQVKLLRVLQNRQYQRMGESKLRNFHGKLIAATNRDLRQEIELGNFREDLYYRLCADVVSTPPLAEHLRDNPAALEDLVAFIARRIAGEEGDLLARQVLDWIQSHLPRDYAWPGNIRELEQCVRNIMIHNRYQPAALRPVDGGPLGQLPRQIELGELTADQLLNAYARILYQRTGSYVQAAKKMGVDRRTLRARCQSPPVPKRE